MKEKIKEIILAVLTVAFIFGILVFLFMLVLNIGMIMKGSATKNSEEAIGNW
jgi:hypothetical protein